MASRAALGNIPLSCAEEGDLPISHPVLNSSSSPSPLQLSEPQEQAWQGLFRRLHHPARRRHPLRVVSIGGSLVVGMGCDDACGHSRRTCSYTSRFARWLAAEYRSTARVHFENRAVGGTTTAGALPQLPLLLQQPGAAQLTATGDGTEADGVDADAGDDADTLPDGDGDTNSGGSAGAAVDVLIIDFAVNDRWERQDWSDAPCIGCHPKTAEIEAATEAMLRYLLREHPGTAVLLVESSCNTMATTGSAHQSMAKAYGVPFLSYEAALKRGVPCGPTSWAPSTSGPHHPGAPTHTYLAFMLAKWWRDALTQYVRNPALRRPVAAADLAERFSVCSTPLRLYDANTLSRETRDGGAVEGIRADGWELQADRLEKPGWIATAPGATIELNLTFGRSPRAVLVYDVSFEGFASVDASFSPGGAQPIDRNKFLLPINGTCPMTHGGAPEKTMPFTTQFVCYGVPYVARIPGMRTDALRVTQTKMLVMNVQQASIAWDESATLAPPCCGLAGPQLKPIEDGGLVGFGIRPHTSHTLRLRHISPNGTKFKLRLVSSC
jgi:hypothetical protein